MKVNCFLHGSEARPCELLPHSLGLLTDVKAGFDEFMINILHPPRVNAKNGQCDPHIKLKGYLGCVLFLKTPNQNN